MTGTALRDLVAETLLRPPAAAAQLIALQLPRALLWQALALAIVLNALVFHLGLLAMPPSQPLPAIMATPFLFALTLGFGAVATVLAITGTGRWLGGVARLEDVLVLIVWLQGLRLLVQVAAAGLTLLAPGPTMLLLMVANLYGLWIFVNFIDTAHRFGSPLKALGVIALAGLGIAFGLVLMLSLFGAGTLGVTADV